MDSADAEVKPNAGGGGGGGGGSSDLKKWWGGESRKHSQGFPRAATQLAKIEAKSLKTGDNPRQLKQSKTTTHAKLLTVLAEFNPNANDDFSGFRRLRDINGTAGVDCVTEPAGTTFSGPLHNQLGDPADFGKDGTPNTIDNNSFWVPDFSPEHYTKMMFSTTGITDRVRPDLTGPDGKPGFDISGYTMKNMYREMSKGAYDLSGQVAPWVMLPHSEAYYAADPCDSGRASDQGHPSNARGAAQMIVDAVNALAAAQPSFPWSQYDLEDQGDLDGDGNVNEPDGVIDHFVIVHPAPARKAAARLRARTPSGRMPRSSTRRPVGTRSPVPAASRCSTTSRSLRTRAWACSRTSLATTSVCRMSTTRAARETPTSSSGA
jgi:Immune inhibitor A peptidase M6, catalytic domain